MKKIGSKPKVLKKKIGGVNMNKLITTPHDFIWRIKNPQDYWADSYKEVKYMVYVNGNKFGGFSGVNRSFDDDMYYVDYYNENNQLSYCSVFRDAEMILEPI